MSFFGESAFTGFVADAFAVFMFILWFWLFITAASDLFRRRDISGLGKVLWIILLIVLPYIGIFAYILTQGGGIADRNRAQGRQARDELRQAGAQASVQQLYFRTMTGAGPGMSPRCRIGSRARQHFDPPRAAWRRT